MKKVMMMNICICVYGCPPYYKASFSLKKPPTGPSENGCCGHCSGCSSPPQEDRITVINTEEQDKPSLFPPNTDCHPISSSVEPHVFDLMLTVSFKMILTSQLHTFTATGNIMRSRPVSPPAEEEE